MSGVIPWQLQKSKETADFSQKFGQVVWMAGSRACGMQKNSIFLARFNYYS